MERRESTDSYWGYAANRLYDPEGGEALLKAWRKEPARHHAARVKAKANYATRALPLARATNCITYIDAVAIRFFAFVSFAHWRLVWASLSVHWNALFFVLFFVLVLLHCYLEHLITSYVRQLVVAIEAPAVTLASSFFWRKEETDLETMDCPSEAELFFNHNRMLGDACILLGKRGLWLLGGSINTLKRTTKLKLE